MAALVETMAYHRVKPWHGLGTCVDHAMTSEEALTLAGLDWRVEKRPIFNEEVEQIPDYFANTRTSDNSILGIVGKKYTIVQNTDAFAFTDALIGEGVTYETAGSLRNGKQIWLLAKMPEASILGDKIEPYMCFTNTHDGLGSVRVCMTPIRVVCNNTLNLAFQGAQRAWSTTHRGNIQDRLHEAEQTLELASKYMFGLDEQASKFANTKVTADWVEEMLDALFPVTEADGARRKENVKRMKDEFYIAYHMPDIKKFQGTAWGVINAASDMLHNDPVRNTQNYQENRWAQVIVGHPLIDTVVKHCNELVAAPKSSFMSRVVRR